MAINKEFINNQGYCNGYAAAATSKDDLYARLEEIPINLRLNAKRHCQTVWALKKYHNNRAKQA
jgi:hypothetical protein